MAPDVEAEGLALDVQGAFGDGVGGRCTHVEEQGGVDSIGARPWFDLWATEVRGAGVYSLLKSGYKVEFEVDTDPLLFGE